MTRKERRPFFGFETFDRCQGARGGPIDLADCDALASVVGVVRKLLMPTCRCDEPRRMLTRITSIDRDPQRSGTLKTADIKRGLMPQCFRTDSTTFLIASIPISSRWSTSCVVEHSGYRVGVKAITSAVLPPAVTSCCFMRAEGGSRARRQPAVAASPRRKPKERSRRPGRGADAERDLDPYHPHPCRLSAELPP